MAYPTKYQWVVQHSDKFKLGFKTDIGAFTYINAQFGVTMEDFVQIGSHCSIYSVSTIEKKKGEVRLRRNSKSVPIRRSCLMLLSEEIPLWKLTVL